MERARLVTVAAAAEKIGMMYCAGGIMAQRDMGLLKSTRVFVGAGMGNLLLAQLMVAQTRLAVRPRCDDPWGRLLAPLPDDADADALMDLFFKPLLKLGERNIEYDMHWARIRACIPWHPLGLLDPWSCTLRDELERHLGFNYAFGRCRSQPQLKEPVTTIDVDDNDAKDGDKTDSMSCPVFLFNSARCDGATGPLCLTNDSGAPSAHGLDVEFLRPSSVPDPSMFLAASILPMDPFPPTSVRIRTVPTNIVSTLRTDPLGLQAAQTYFLKERLAPRADVKENGVEAAETVLLYDAFSFCPASRALDVNASRNICVMHHNDLTGATDVACERPRAYHKKTVRMYDRTRMGLLDDDPSSNRNALYDAFDSHQENGQSILAYTDPEVLQHAANAGYFDTVDAFGDTTHRLCIAKRPIPLCPDVGDTFGLAKQLFGDPKPDK